MRKQKSGRDNPITKNNREGKMINKKFIKKSLAVMLSTAMIFTTGMPITALQNTVKADTVSDVTAAPKCEELTKWTFDSDTESWAKSGWSSTGLTGSVANEDGKLKFTADYTTITATWYQGDIQLYKSADYSEATNASMELYCKTSDQQPTKVDIIFANSGGNNAKDSVSLANVTDKETVQINGEDYTKYNLSIPLNMSETNVGYRQATTNLIIQVVRGDATFSGDVYFDNITLNKDNAKQATIDKDAAVYNEAITAGMNNDNEATDYQWYKASSYTGEGTAIENGTSAAYTPDMEDIDGWIYCGVVSGGYKYLTKRVRVLAGTTLKATDIPLSATAVSDGGSTIHISNTKDYSGKFDSNLMVNGGNFYVEYTGEIADVPQFEFATWSSTKSTVDVTAYESGSVEGQEGTYYARYKYEDFVSAWGDEDVSELKALRIKYAGTDNTNLTLTKVTWNGAPISYGDLGEVVNLLSNGQLYTWHVGVTFDATRIREDSFFYVEYKGDEDGISFVANSHSYVSNGYNAYVTISTPYKKGTTGSGYYNIYTASQIKEAFGDQFRYVDQLRVVTNDGKTVANKDKKLYFFEGTGALVDDISADGYTDAIDVPWVKYADEAQDGTVIIGASITQNPLVTPAAMEGAPFYNARGGWNAMLDRTDCITYGIGGQTTTNVANRFGEILKYNYKRIIMQVGNNDLGTYNDDQKVVDLEVGNYTKMLNLVKVKNEELAAEGKDIIPVYIIGLNPTNSEGIQGRIIKVNTAIEELSNTYDFVKYISIYDEFVNSETGSPTNPDCGEYHVNMDLVMADGLHPVAAGYKIWAQKLKKVMASTDKADTTLTTLSYRLSDTVKKNAVTGFETGKEDTTTYDVVLPGDTAKDGTFKLYETPSNLSAKVVADNGTITADSYDDDYVPVTLVDGKATVKLTVTSEDESATKEYTVNFTIDSNDTSNELVNDTTEKAISVTDDTVDTWPYTQYSFDSVEITPNSTVEMDVALDNSDFTGLYLETDLDWTMLKAETLKPADFTDNVAHLTYTYTGEAKTISTLQVKTGGNGTDYRGDIKVSNLKITKGTSDAEDDETGWEKTTLFSGSEETTLKSIFTSGNIEMDTIKDKGYFYVEYTANEKQAVKIALSEWDTSKWVEVEPSETGTTEDGNYFAKYSIKAVTEAYGATDLSDVDAISVKCDNTITLKELSWVGPKAADDGAEILFSGSKTAKGNTSLFTYLYTKHVGGDFDNASIRYGSYFTLEYTGTKDKINVCLSSASRDDHTWVAVKPTSTVTLDNGHYLSTYTIEDCIEAFTSNLQRLDQIQIYTSYDTGEENSVTLKKWKFYQGDGELVDPNGESKWTNKADTGIGFIGDSIVQNALLSYGDFNTILGRTDCSNWGIGGQTTTHISRRIDDMLEMNYHKIVILCGINDMGAGITKEETLENYELMLTKIHNKLPNTKVYTISVLPTTTPFYYTPENQEAIRSVDEGIKAFSDKYDFVTYVDCYSKFLGDDGYCKPELVSDGLHPNEEGYKVIASVLNPILSADEEPTTENPTTENPTTEAPTTEAPTTQKPTEQITTTAKISVARAKVKSASKKYSSKKMKISLKKVSGVAKYQIQISNSKKFKKVIATKTVKGTKVSYSSKKIRKKKTLYIRVRAIKIVDKKNYTGKWSKVKKVKVTK